MRTLFRRSVVLAALAAAMTSGCITRGSGQPRREVRKAEHFTEIDAGGVFDVQVEIGEQAAIEVVGDDNVVPLVRTTVTGDRLHIELEGNISPKVDLVVRITTPALERLRSSGAGKTRVTGLRGETFEIDASGASSVTLDGSVEILKLDLSGAGRVDALELQAQTVEADLSGAGSAELTATRRLVAHISGAGSVRYAGDPVEVERHISGAGSVEPR